MREKREWERERETWGSGANTQTHILFDLDTPLVGINPTDQLASVQNGHAQKAMHSNTIQGSKGQE